MKVISLNLKTFQVKHLVIKSFETVHTRIKKAPYDGTDRVTKF